MQNVEFRRNCEFAMRRTIGNKEYLNWNYEMGIWNLKGIVNLQ